MTPKRRSSVFSLIFIVNCIKSVSNKFNYILLIKGHEGLKLLSTYLFDVILQHLADIFLPECFIFSREATKLGINF